MSLRFLCLWAMTALGLAFVSRAQLRAGMEERCALDGAMIRRTARVDLLLDLAAARSFCSAECALAWPALEKADAAFRFQVHAEEDGRALDPRAAHFVRSNLQQSGGRAQLRAFRDAITAAEHLRLLGGYAVPNPFPE